MFNWFESSLVDCAKHIATVNSANTAMMISYYKRVGDSSMVDKIIEARKLAKKYRLLNKAMEVSKELGE